MHAYTYRTYDFERACRKVWGAEAWRSGIRGVRRTLGGAHHRPSARRFNAGEGRPPFLRSPFRPQDG